MLCTLKENLLQEPTSIVIFLPKIQAITVIKKLKEGDVIENVSSLGKGILKELGELVVHHSHDNSNGTNLQPLPPKVNLLSLNLGEKKQKTLTQ